MQAANSDGGRLGGDRLSGFSAGAGAREDGPDLVGFERFVLQEILGEQTNRVDVALDDLTGAVGIHAPVDQDELEVALRGVFGRNAASLSGL